MKFKNKAITLKNGDKFSVVPAWTGNDELDKLIEAAGYSYDQKQDIFYSNMNAWQRKIGYCHFYDEMAAPFGMIIDCEPIYFEYLGKKWMIGFWKGQYDLVTGGEIGVYTKAYDVKVAGLFNGAYYESAGNADLLQMSYTLKKNGITLFTREDRHWWLTGFKLGEFSNPSELTMDVKLTLQNVVMRDAFVMGLWNAGYTLDEFSRDGNTICFTFNIPHTPQPITRTPTTDRIIQKKNQFFCKKYQAITSEYNNLPDKVKAIEKRVPEMYHKVIRAGKSQQLYEMFSTWLTRSIMTKQ